MRTIIKLEKRIKGKMNAIKKGETTPVESGIGVLMNLLNNLDEASHEKRMIEYKEVLKDIKK